ncbi:MAG: ABC transporter ATP-binding protein [Methanocorpusculum sp.]|nr:ABC transporter ATP-binding protein [Methanocorpusculum sp.]
MENAVSVKNLCKDYDGFSLDVSFDLPKGSIMGFIGENGAGKTTTIKAILGLIKINSGEVEIFGKKLSEDEKEIKEKIGVVFDECCLHDNLTPSDFIKIFAGIYKNFDKDLYEKYLNDFKLPKDKKIKIFSQGMKMKLSIASALSHKPELLILDEPTSGLDPVVREEILDIFLDFIQDENHSILISSHITSDLDKIADYLTFIHDGKIVLSDSKDEIIENMGILKCSPDELNKFKAYAVSYRTNQFGCEILVKNKSGLLEKFPNSIIDSANTESIMVMLSRGDKL